MLAAVDLGSNSFHLGLAEINDGAVEIKLRLREKIQLAAGLDEQKNLDDSAMTRALNCLTQFGEYTKSLPAAQVRVVGTNTFREACNLEEFLKKAQQALGHPIEIITGQEEARLIYMGVTQVKGIPPERLFVLDIGGGSTELAIGQNGVPQWLQSISIGCVSFTKRFFPDMKNTSEAVKQAKAAAKSALEKAKIAVEQQNWEISWGTSGTIDAVDSVLKTILPEEEGITLNGLYILQEALLAFPSTHDIVLPGLREDRATIFSAGVAILTAAFETFNIPRMHIAGAALREGLIAEMIQKL